MTHQIAFPPPSTVPELALAKEVRAMFLGNEQGAWYDPSDMSTLFQDAAGTTPVTSVEQPVGLVLDKSRGLVFGPELVANGDFSGGMTGWLRSQPSWAISDGKASNDGTNTVHASLRQNGVFTLGKSYLIEWDQVTNSGFANLYNAGTPSQLITNGVTGTGKKSIRMTATTSGALFFEAAPGAVVSLDNISIRELPGNHAFQATAASRPVLSARVNLLLNTGFTGGTSGAPGTAPTNWLIGPTGAPSLTYEPDIESQGGFTARVVVNSAQRSNIYQAVPQSVAANTTYIFSAVVDVTVGSGINQHIFIANPPVGSTSTWKLNGVTVSNPNTALPAGRQIIAVELAVGATAGTASMRIGAGLQTFSSGCDITIRQVSLVVANQASLPYQRVNTATDYDTAGFPHYLRFDGVDDFLQTNAINFTSTDKMTVFAGVRKLSDAAFGLLVELSASVLSNNGAFALTVPGGAGSPTDFWNSSGTTRVFPSTSSIAPQTLVYTGTSDISAPSAVLRKNGVQAALVTSSQGTGTYGNYPLYIGRRAGTSLPFNGHLYQLIVRGAQSSLPQVQAGERWTNNRTGAY
jgi:hypothetical protein